MASNELEMTPKEPMMASNEMEMTSKNSVTLQDSQLGYTSGDEVLRGLVGQLSSWINNPDMLSLYGQPT